MSITLQLTWEFREKANWNIEITKRFEYPGPLISSFFALKHMQQWEYSILNMNEHNLLTPVPACGGWAVEKQPSSRLFLLRLISPLIPIRTPRMGQQLMSYAVFCGEIMRQQMCNSQSFSLLEKIHFRRWAGGEIVHEGNDTRLHQISR